MELSLADRQQLLRETAGTTLEAQLKFHELAQAMTGPILQKLEEESIMRQLFTVERLAPGAQPEYPVATDFETPVWILPQFGYIAQNYVEGLGESVFVPTFNLSASNNWKVDYARDGRIDIVNKAKDATARQLAEMEEECGWRVIAPAVTTNFGGMGILAPRPAPIYQMPSSDPASGYLSKELINRMIVGMDRLGRELNELWVSPEDLADIREWTDTDVDPITRREIFQAAGMGKIWNVTLRKVRNLGVKGKYNINDKTSLYGPFKGKAADNTFNNYTVTNGNILDVYGNLDTPGETQIYGFDVTFTDALVMPVRKEYEPIDDPALLRQQLQGYFGWSTLGFGILDSRSICMGIIDRATS